VIYDIEAHYRTYEDKKLIESYKNDSSDPKTYNLTDVKIILFSPTLFLTGTKWKNFRKEFFKYFNFTAFDTGNVWHVFTI
jgi:hypothetical protein